MEALINYLLQFGSLNTQQIEFIKSKVTVMELKKGAYFLEAGKIPRKIGFVEEGVFRSCYYNNKGDEITRYFMSEGAFVVDYNSYEAQIPSSEYIQALTDAKLLIFSREAMAELGLTIMIWDSMVSKIANKALVEKFQRVSPMLSEDATTRYLNFVEHFPNLANRIPLSLLASYLGITQSSLSRIRRNI